VVRIYVGGVPGSGKTSTLKKISELNSDISVISSSKLLQEALGLSNKEDLSHCPVEELNNIRNIAIPGFINNHTNVVIDGHYFLTEKVAGLFDGFVYIDIDLETLIQFRKNDLEFPNRSIDRVEVLKEITDYKNRLVEKENCFHLKILHIKNEGTIEDLAIKILNYYYYFEQKSK
jgi:adenylate kinase